MAFSNSRPHWLGGASAWLSAALLGAALLSGLLGASEDFMEWLVLSAPLALLPLVPTFHRLYRARHPRLSALAQGVGGVSLSAPLLLLLVGAGMELARVPFPTMPPWWGMFLVALLGGVGAWLLLVGGMAWTTRCLPIGWAALSGAAGGTWLVIIASILLGFVAPAAVQALTPLLGLNLLLWLCAYTLWTLWTGWLWLTGSQSVRWGHVPQEAGEG